MAYSAFQSNAFQNNAFQIVTSDTNTGGGGYVPPYEKYREDQYQRKNLQEHNADLKRIDDELAEAEQRKQEQLAAQKKLKAKNSAKKLAALEALLQEEINRLRTERVWLMRQIDEEEAIFVLLLSMPLH